MSREKEMAAAGKEVHAAIQAMTAKGHDEQDVSNAMFAYALSLMGLHWTRQEIARHLYAMALRFADPNDDPLHQETRN